MRWASHVFHTPVLRFSLLFFPFLFFSLPFLYLEFTFQRFQPFIIQISANISLLLSIFFNFYYYYYFFFFLETMGDWGSTTPRYHSRIMFWARRFVLSPVRTRETDFVSQDPFRWPSPSQLLHDCTTLTHLQRTRLRQWKVFPMKVTFGNLTNPGGTRVSPTGPGGWTRPTLWSGTRRWRRWRWPCSPWCCSWRWRGTCASCWPSTPPSTASPACTTSWSTWASQI